MKTHPPIPHDLWLQGQEHLIDRGADPLDQLLEQQAEEDARRDREHDHTHIFRSTAA